MSSRVQSRPLISIRPNATVQEAAQLMADCSMACVGVFDENKQFAGIITERDLCWFVAQAKNAESVTVGEVANDFPVVVEGPIDDARALERMREARIRHLIVREGDDFRIVSMRDYMHSFNPDHGLTARTVMTAPAIACRDEAFCFTCTRRSGGIAGPHQ